MKKIWGFLMVSIVLLACEKVDLDGEFAVIKGDYEWEYSFSDGTHHYSGLDENRYAIRITDKDCFIFFINGEEVERHKIRSVQRWEDGRIQIGIKMSSSSTSLMYISDDGTLESKLYPKVYQGGMFKRAE